MECEARRIGNVEGLGDVYQVAAPLDEQLRAFGKVGIYSLAGPDEVARIRLAGLSDDFSRVDVASVAMKGKRTILIRGLLNPLRNPLMATAAVAAHRKRDYFETKPDIYEAAEVVAKAQESMIPEHRSAMFVSQKRDFDLTADHPESRFLLRGEAVPYFEKRTNGKIRFCGFSIDSKDVAGVNYSGFYSPQYGSSFGCWGRGLGYDGHAFGILHSADVRRGGPFARQGVEYTLGGRLNPDPTD